jgi:hypothetical protein
MKLVSKHRNALTAMAIFLMISMSASVMLIPSASAHSPSVTIPTWAYISAAPNPIGVGQQLTIYFWLNQVFGYYAAPGSTTTTDYAQITNTYRFQNFNLTIVAPDGSVKTTIYPYISDPTSSMYTTYTPNETGTYNLIFNFPGQPYTQITSGGAGTYDQNSVMVNDTYAPSSANTTITVQQTAIPAASTGSLLPTSYWARPIYGENTFWYTISSNWLGTGMPVNSATGAGTPSFATSYPTSSYIQGYPGDAVGPLTSHIMWTYPIQGGGIVGGNMFANAQGVGYFEGSAYNNRFANPIILDGHLYYKLPVSFTGPSSGAEVCQDLRTGKIIWESTQIPTLSFGYIYNVYDPNQHGAYPPILFTSNFAQAFDAYTGDPLFNVTGVPTGTSAAGPSGEQLRYVLTNIGTSASPNWYLAEWNSSRLWETYDNPFTGAAVNSPTMYNDSFTNGTTLPTADAQYANVTEPTITTPAGTDPTQPALYDYTIYGNVVNSSSSLYSYDWNVSTSGLNSMSTAPTVLAALYGNLLLCKNGSYPIGSPTSVEGALSWTPYTYFAINLNASRGTVGSVLWWNTITPSGNVSVSFGGVDPTAWNGNGYGVFVEAHRETMNFVGYSLTTGQQIWGPTASQPAFDYYGSPGAGTLVDQVAYGNLYSSAFAGVLYCYNLTNGNIEWTYGNGGSGNSTNSGFNTSYGDYPTFINAVGNGVIYLVTTEHTITDPIYKGALARAVNATNGAEIWTLSDYTGEFTGESYAIADGQSVFFNGYDDQVYSVGQGPSATTVTAPSAALSFGQPVVIKGTVMDISAGTEQSTVAADFPNGVPCTSDASMTAWMGYVYQQQPMPTNFTVLDSNGNCRVIGTAITDSSGTYRLSWTPDIAGNYTVYANFLGTNGYYPSSAEDGFTVMNASTSTATPTATPTSVADAYFVPSIAAIIVVIIIGFAVLAILTLRKHP